jgi:LuxR family maltose regulon positive regulatory protein
MAILKKAISLAEPEGYIRLFVDEGPRMVDLLQEAAEQDISPGYVSALLEAFQTKRLFGGELAQKSTPLFTSTQPLVESISEREMEVLYLLSRGLSNQEIAAEMIIAKSTAKKHVSNIIGKLGVSNRTQAVVKARDLNIIE